jgi:hypothetical protein
MNDELSLTNGYRLEAQPGSAGQELRLHAPDGRICLKITLGADGPMVELASAGLSIEARGDVRVACDSFEVAARDRVTLSSGGDIEARAERTLKTDAFEQFHDARLGDYRIRANDDLRLDGERIRLNSTEPLPPADPSRFPRLAGSR